MIAIEVAQVCRNFKEKLNILANCVEQKVIKIWSIFFQDIVILPINQIIWLTNEKSRKQ